MSICSIYEEALNTFVDVEKDGPILTREFEICQDADDIGELEDFKFKRRSTDTILEEPEGTERFQSEELHEAVNYKKLSRYSTASQSTDATVTSVSAKSLEWLVGKKEPLQMSILALDNLSE